MMSQADLLRTEIFAKMKALSPEARVEHAHKLQKRLQSYFQSLGVEYFQLKNYTVALYRSMGGEIDFSPAIQFVETQFNLTNRPRFCFPVAHSGQPLRFYEVKTPILKDENWQKSPYGFFEPLDRSREIQIEEIDLFFIPGIAFTADGKRIGRGKGHYDRTLAHARRGAEKIGIAYDFQVVDDFPIASWDQRLDQVLTS